MSAPRIDVLMPVLCARDTLPEAVDDALGQRGVEVRLLAVVDVPPGGDDGSADWLAERARRDERLEVLRGRGEGVGAALDLGLAAVSSPWLAHMEADDRCQPDRLRRQLEVLEEVDSPRTATAAAITSSRSVRLDAVTCRVAQAGMSTPGMARYLDWQNTLLTHEKMARGRWIEIPAMHQSGLYRTDTVRACGGYTPRGNWPADIDFWFRWFELAEDLRGVAPEATRARTAKLPRVMYHWRQHAAQSTRGAPTHSLSVLREAKAHYLARRVGRCGRTPRPVHLVSTGSTLRAWDGALRRAGVELAASTEWRPVEQVPRPVIGSVVAGTLLIAAYGRVTARRRVRGALAAAIGAPPIEPDALLFTA